MMAERLGPAVRTAFGALCLVALGACGASSDGQGRTPTVGSPAASSSPSPDPKSGPLAGVWKVTFGADDSVGSGGWTLTFRDGKVTLTNGEGDTGPGTLPFTLLPGNQIRFPADRGCPGQEKGPGGLYEFAVSGSTLTFTEVGQSDTCRDHAATLTTKPWTR
jgi:hypothetical protein